MNCFKSFSWFQRYERAYEQKLTFSDHNRLLLYVVNTGKDFTVRECRITNTYINLIGVQISKMLPCQTITFSKSFICHCFVDYIIYFTLPVSESMNHGLWDFFITYWFVFVFQNKINTARHLCSKRTNQIFWKQVEFHVTLPRETFGCFFFLKKNLSEPSEEHFLINWVNILNFSGYLKC